MEASKEQGGQENAFSNQVDLTGLTEQGEAGRDEFGEVDEKVTEAFREAADSLESRPLDEVVSGLKTKLHELIDGASEENREHIEVIIEAYLVRLDNDAKDPGVPDLKSHNIRDYITKMANHQPGTEVESEGGPQG